MKRLILVLGMVSIVAWGCSKTSPTSPGNGGNPQVIPLAVGNWWAYGPEGGNATDTSKVTAHTSYNGNSAYVITYTNHPEDTLIAFYEGDFLKALTTVGTDTTRTHILINYLKLPLRVGESWLSYDTTVIYNGAPFRVVDSALVVSQEAVNVPAGNFNNAYKIKFTTKIIYNGNVVRTTYRYDFIVDGIGEVKNISNEGRVNVLYGYYIQ